MFSTQKAIIITYLNAEKKMANYITEDGKVGFFNYSRLKKCRIKESNIYLTTFVKESASGPSDVFSLKEIEECTNYPTLRKEVYGIIKILPAGVGFVENCFVPSQLIQQYETAIVDNKKLIAQHEEDVKLLSKNKKNLLPYSIGG